MYTRVGAGLPLHNHNMSTLPNTAMPWGPVLHRAAAGRPVLSCSLCVHMHTDVGIWIQNDDQSTDVCISRKSLYCQYPLWKKTWEHILKTGLCMYTILILYRMIHANPPHLPPSNTTSSLFISSFIPRLTLSICPLFTRWQSPALARSHSRSLTMFAFSADRQFLCGSTIRLFSRMVTTVDNRSSYKRQH